MLSIRPASTIETLKTMSDYPGLTASERNACRDAAVLLNDLSSPSVIVRADIPVTPFGWLEERGQEGVTAVIIGTRRNRDNEYWRTCGEAEIVLHTGTGTIRRDLKAYNRTWRIWDAVPEKAIGWMG